VAPADILQPQRKRPFEPFRIEVSDGTAYEIRHPEMVMVTVGSVVIGIPPVGATLPPSERYETVSIRHIFKMFPLTQSAAGSGNGES
jgi:hypothetical protein